MATASYQQIITVGGVTYRGTVELEAEGNASQGPVTLPAAAAGALTTRTSDSVGVLTLTTGHGLTTGAVVNLFWTKPDGTQGCRYNITLGTVAAPTADTAVPLTDSGTGDVLPADETAITVSAQVEINVDVDGDDFVFLMAHCDGLAHLQFQEEDNTVLLATALVAGKPRVWAGASGASFDGGTTPVTGDPVGHLVASNGDTTASVLNVVILYDSVA